MAADGAGPTPGLHGFSPALTSFVGRADAVRAAADLLGAGRLVTVVGPGGVGKTRLAGEVARRVTDRFADGVCLVELAAISDPGQVPGAVAASMRIPPRPGVPPTEALAAALARQQVLIVLDNCEHVIRAVAELCAALIPAADDLRVLATSREPVGLAGESRYRLPPLSVPEPGRAAGGSEAEALFTDRAREADPGFRLDGETGPLVAQLVRQLDGLPLALELAAARIESLGLKQLLSRLDQRLSLLSGADRLAAARQQSLVATVDWSYQLLSQAEQRVFRHLSAFPGLFTLEGAEAVAGPGAGPAVLRLVDCSLLVPPSSGRDGRSRYMMLDTLRAYGAGQLADAGEQPAARAALARYALHVAEKAAAGMRTSREEPPAVRWLDNEGPTLRLALDWALGHAPDVAVRLAGALGPWWYIRGQLVTVRPLLQAAAAHSEAPGDQWCAIQYWVGQAYFTSSDFTLARDSYSTIIEAIGGQSPRPALADALAGRAFILASTGQVQAGLDDARRAVAVARDVGHQAGEVLALNILSFIHYFTDDMETALSLARQATHIDPDFIPGWIARETRLCLSMFLTETGDWAEAENICADSLAQAREADDLRSEAMCLGFMTDLDTRARRITDACRHLRESLQLSARIGDPFGVLTDLDRAGLLCVATGRWAEAITLWAAFATCSREDDLGDVPWDARRREEASRQARKALGPVATRAAEQRGEAMSLTTAIELVAMITLNAPRPSAPSGRPAGVSGSRLSARESELVTLVARGRTDAQIASELFISIRTVRSHLDRIRDKTGCRRRADLTRLALEEGLV
ncbi:MAG TPA: LuxR C-terminal-related transcriptional regulator [Streptosporangiaceae bacterium]|nr:LuxR C-terminal-related transcriptional regulator [Streptosporangiaceae bacterium]